MDTDFAARLRAGDPVVGCWVTVGHPTVAELLAGEGFDFLALDREHAANSLSDVADMARAVDAADGDAAVLVRVAENDPNEIQRVLDVGPDGIIVPQVHAAEGAERVVEASRYPPEGSRGVGATRPSGYGRTFDEYVAEADEGLLRLVQAESRAAVENAADVAAVEGVDGLFVGPADLSASLGCFRRYDDPDFRDAVATIVDAAHDADGVVGTLATSEENVATRHRWGADFVVTGVDTGYLREAAARYRAAYADARADEGDVDAGGAEGTGGGVGDADR